MRAESSLYGLDRTCSSIVLRKMTGDELEKYLFETLAPSLEDAWRNEDAAGQKLAEKGRDLERERQARKATEKKVADKKKENARLKKALEDFLTNDK